MNEIVFIVEVAPEGGYQAYALGESIFTEAETMHELHQQVYAAVDCHFDESIPSVVITLHLHSNNLPTELRS